MDDITQRLWRLVDPRRVSALYIGIAVVLAFGIWIPKLFFSLGTFRTTLSALAIPGILAIGLVLPLAAGAYDLSVGWVLGLSAAVSTNLMLHGVNPVVASLAGMGAGLLVGI